MKKLSFSIILLLLSLCVFAQKQKKYYEDEYGNPMHYDIGNPWARNALILLVDGGAKRVEPFRRYGQDDRSFGNLVYLEGATIIELESLIHKDSLKLYRYTIIENDTVYLTKDAIPKKIKAVWNERSDFPDYVTIDLGKINVVNKKIEVKLERIDKKYPGLNQAIIYNKRLQPAKIVMARIIEKTDKNIIRATPLKDGDTIINDNSTVGFDLAMQSTGVNFIYEILIKNTTTRGSYRSFLDWKFDGKNKAIVSYAARDFKDPGTYEIAITPKVGSSWNRENWKDNENTVRFKFTVAKNNDKTFKIRELIIIGLIATAVFGAILGGSVAYIKKKNQKKLFLSQQQKEISKTQLNSIRAQLNPHFMFNALAGIQNLMNQNKIDEANHYLGKFARLTRNVLDQHELISLSNEKELLEDYLQMEQLRFGFTYEIEIRQQMDLNVEIPSMLLQPFVENAVKHGIASKLDKGHIKVSFATQNKDLILSVKDNGIGFDTLKTYEGLGLQLSKNRITLLNTIYAETPLILEMKSDANETTMKITLTQWL